MKLNKIFTTGIIASQALALPQQPEAMAFGTKQRSELEIRQDAPPQGAQDASTGDAMANDADDAVVADKARQAHDEKWGSLADDIKNEDCTNPAVKDANQKSNERWNSLKADEVFEVANSAYLEAHLNNTLNIGYTEYISHFFNGPEGWSCPKIANQPCTNTIQCDDVNHPAGYFILNSISVMHALCQNMYDAMNNARGDLMFSMKGFMDVFAPKAKEDLPLEIFKVILDTALFMASIGSAWGWNKMIKVNGPSGLTGDNRGFLKDTFNAALAYSINMSKDNRKSPKTTVEQQGDLEGIANSYYQYMMDTVIDFNKHIFEGRPDTIYALAQAMKDGKLMPNNDIGLDEQNFKRDLNSAVWAKLIPLAWKSNPERKLNPVVLASNDKCDGSERKTTADWFPDDTATKTRVCIQDHAVYLLHGVPRENCMAAENCLDAGKPWFEPLPGGTHDELNGDKWGPIKLEDIVQSVFDGFIQAKGNGYVQPTEPPGNNVNDLNSWFDGLNLNSAGFWQGIPFCAVGVNVLSELSGQGPSGDFYPCNGLPEKTQ